jgi:glutamate--cysteine ligase
VRLMDLDPFVPVGIEAPTMRFLDTFLLHCLLNDSPPDTPQEISALARNQQKVATRGREPGLMLERAGREMLLTQWGSELVDQCAPIAAALDAAHGGTAYSDALVSARAALADPSLLPSARVLAAVAKDHENSYIGFVRAQSDKTRSELLALPYPPAMQARFEAEAAASIDEQKKLEAADSMPFEIYRQQYLSPERLGLGHRLADSLAHAA